MRLDMRRSVRDDITKRLAFRVRTLFEVIALLACATSTPRSAARKLCGSGQPVASCEHVQGCDQKGTHLPIAQKLVAELSSRLNTCVYALIGCLHSCKVFCNRRESVLRFEREEAQGLCHGRLSSSRSHFQGLDELSRCHARHVKHRCRRGRRAWSARPAQTSARDRPGPRSHRLQPHPGRWQACIRR